MIVDSSAVLAILFSEPEESRLTAAILASSARAVSAATLLETSMVFEGRARSHTSADFDQLIATLNLSIDPFTATQAAIAREGFRRFGKGRHPASLNFGDCFSYALAKERGEPLLFKGTDFSKTDIQVAAY